MSGTKRRYRRPDRRAEQADGDREQARCRRKAGLTSALAAGRCNAPDHSYSGRESAGSCHRVAAGRRALRFRPLVAVRAKQAAPLPRRSWQDRLGGKSGTNADPLSASPASAPSDRQEPPIGSGNWRPAIAPSEAEPKPAASNSGFDFDFGFNRERPAPAVKPAANAAPAPVTPVPLAPAPAAPRPAASPTFSPAPVAPPPPCCGSPSSCVVPPPANSAACSPRPCSNSPRRRRLPRLCRSRPRVHP